METRSNDNIRGYLREVWFHPARIMRPLWWINTVCVGLLHSMELK